ncbi:MAG: lycopene cyclase domain-containing protein [Candidatus Omnitrophota bacterium]|nr:MAG: lycopene cyclase domain-containing protein [Candidatus Omnitrophota bacterium]
MSQYLILLITSASIPFVASFWPALGFWRHWRALVGSIGCIVGIFGMWDIFATYRGHWWFSSEGVYPLRIINLPLEEVLFFIAIPFCCIFTWEAVQYIKKRLS